MLLPFDAYDVLGSKQESKSTQNMKSVLKSIVNINNEESDIESDDC